MLLPHPPTCSLTMTCLTKAAALLLLIAGMVPNVLSRSLLQNLQADVLVIGAGMSGLAVSNSTGKLVYGAC